MEKILIALLLALSVTSANGYDIVVNSPRVIDGDTIDLNYKPFSNLNSVLLRISGVDTPELKGKCEKEKLLAKQAKEFMAFTVKDQQVGVKIISWDKYGGRVVGTPFLHEVSLSEELIRRGFAVPYNGGKKTKDWCK